VDVIPETMPTASEAAHSEWIPKLAPLMGTQVLVLHGPDSDEAGDGLSGTDVDCVVDALDPMWPLRLPPEWRLCQSLHYDLLGWYWVLEREGDLIALDTIDDPRGLGRDGIRTNDLFDDGSNIRPRPDVRAAYLAIKRLRKNSLSAHEWSRIGRLARQDVDAFRGTLRRLAGAGVARMIADSAIAGAPPDRSLLQRAAVQRNLRRFGSPVRVGAAIILGVRRYAERIVLPTGLFVLVTGPDGSGKSSLAGRLPELSRGIFKRHLLTHWRPGVLPRPGAIVGRPPPDPTRPHDHPPHGPVMSLALTGYYWLDFIIGGWFLNWSVLIRAGLLVRERGWWDMAVDPLRYRLSTPPRVIRALGSFVRYPDLALVLEAAPEVLVSRKAELEPDEARRQTSAWRTALPGPIHKAFVDASAPLNNVEQEARARVLEELESRTVARLGAGWVSVPRRGSPRWWVPRGREYAYAGLSMYQPVTKRARVGWEGARWMGALGGLRALPRGSAPPREVRSVLAKHMPPRSTVAVTRANHPGRFVAVIIGDEGSLHAVAKVATDEAGREALAREVGAIERLGALLPQPLATPDLLEVDPGLLLMVPVRWRPRWRPWEVDEDLAAGLGAFFAAGSGDRSESLVGPAHGDFAPWNVLRTDTGWTLVDWEAAAEEAPPFYDLCHYVVQSYSLLGRPGTRAVLDGFLEGRGPVGRAVNAYSRAAGIAAGDAAEYLLKHLTEFRTAPSLMQAEAKRAASRRARLQAELRRTR
jgi:hypothetical protein